MVSVKWTIKYKAPLLLPGLQKKQIEGKIDGYMWGRLFLFMLKYNPDELSDLCGNIEAFQTAFDSDELTLNNIKSIKFEEIRIEKLFKIEKDHKAQQAIEESFQKILTII